MFTGIVEETGVVRQIQSGAASSNLVIQGELIFDDLKVGDSVAVNGVCLTATNVSKCTFGADVMHETLKRSSLGGLGSGSRVNLERAMAANGRFGGHMVSGHIDGTGQVAAVTQDDIAVLYTIQTSEQITKYIIEKGSIAVDGISLTVVYVATDRFQVSVIPHTVTATTLAEKKVGAVVNLENDMVGKYMEKLSGYHHKETPKSNITKEFLIKNGFGG
jgi:riboflavin synthase